MAVVFEFDEPCEFVRPGETYQITSYVELLSALGVLDGVTDPQGTPTATQRAAIETWLAGETPGFLLRLDLEDRGISVRHLAPVS